MIQDLNQHVKRTSVIMPVPVISDKQNDKRKLADAIIRKWNKKLNFRLGDFSPPPSLYVVQPLKNFLCMSSLSQFQIITWNIQTRLFIILSHLQLFFLRFCNILNCPISLSEYNKKLKRNDYEYSSFLIYSIQSILPNSLAKHQLQSLTSLTGSLF